MPRASRGFYAPSTTKLKRLVHELFCLALLAIFPRETTSRTDRVNLVPKLQAGQTLNYEVSYRSDKQTNTKSSVIFAQAPAASKLEVRALLHLEILGVDAQQQQRSLIHARARFESLDSDAAKRDSPATDTPPNQTARDDPQQFFVEFTIFPDGRVDQVNGLDVLPPAQQLAWQAWVARFAAAAVFPAGGVKLSQKWKSEEIEKSPSPIAGLAWTRESTYVRNEPCRTMQMTTQGDVVESDQLPDTCAVILTTADLRQTSPQKDTTPGDFKLHQLRTKGTARGRNQTVTVISLKTGLLVRASDDADQTMDVTIAKADGSNRVHYNVRAKSNAEVLLIADAPPKTP